MDTIKFRNFKTLMKEVDVNVKAIGSWCIGRSRKDREYFIPIDQVDVNNSRSIQLTSKQACKILSTLNKKGTDLLTDGNLFYIIRGNLLLNINHRMLITL